jgi:hypothetical protein
MTDDQKKLLSRRAFARRAALFSASAALLTDGTFRTSNVLADVAVQLPADLPKLSPESQAEAEARFQLVLSRHGARLSEEEKRNVRTLCYFSQPGLDRLRSFALKNGDVPALFLKPIVERDKPASSNRPTTAPFVAPKHS